ncbi:MAG TPA: hypothetical protein VH853_00040 [Polyangia bacterium]|nr:hypothetical protein [Polyangia bacterium]
MTRPCALLLLLAASACGRSVPGVLVGETAHFRLYVDPAVDPSSVPSYMLGDDGLAALETDWADKQSMLGMPEGPKIDYHLLSLGSIAGACGSADDEGCEWEGSLEIDAISLPNQHELMHAYMALLSSGYFPLPLIAEGTAQAIGCNRADGWPFFNEMSWEQAVMEVPAADEEVYGQGGLLTRYLIRTQGIDAFVRYYRQAPAQRDPALFAANFAAFWNMSIDDVWAAVHTIPPASDGTDQTICPCSLPPLPTDGQPIPNDQATAPYWTLPDTMGDPLALASSTGLSVWECQGALNPGGEVVLFQPPPDGRRRYVTNPIDSATVGPYLTDSCTASAPIAIPAPLPIGSGSFLQVSAAQATNVPTEAYLQIQAPVAVHLQVLIETPSSTQLTEVCDSCAFDQGACQPVAVGAGQELAPGTSYLRLTLPARVASTFLPSNVTFGLVFN